ncbi:fluoride efflux transporter CrcB [Sediminibacillus massiliensis]|uniref:fluoride efflux transporter CrcB n=1 Tax=Sediminibacillus massiliensis TaxID=1926277 RepID=UPI00098830A1|nr:fluoride efflux transporter CrcB [Sediminibacillus massiliensis]
MNFLSFLFVGIGGFAGAISRFAVSRLVNRYRSSQLPVATLIVNLAGSFLLGIVTGAGFDGYSALLVGTGFMGSFTTFSTFKLEGIQLHLGKRKKEFILYNLLSYGGGILLAFLGWWFGTKL